MRRFLMAGAVGLAGLLAVSCSTTPTTGGAARGTTPGSAPVSSGGARVEPTKDEVTPLIVTPIGELIPVKGSDERYHVAYELEILNYSPRDAEITTIETVDASSDRVVSTIAADEVLARSILVGSASATPQPVTGVPAGRTVLVLIDDSYATRGEVPSEVVHRIRADFAPPRADQAPYVGQLFPSTVTQTTAPLRLGAGEPLRIGAPLEGDNWLAVNACCDDLNPHRGAMLPMSGRINATERYAIDWIQIDPARAEEMIAQRLMPSFTGDRAANASYLAYDEPLLAVADGTVTSTVDSYDDAIPPDVTPGLAVDELGGNTVIIDLGGGFYAFYGHVVRGSITVKPGDKVTKGQVIGRLGNTGNSTEAHLHFHIMRGPTPLGSTNWPYEIESFDLAGSFSEAGIATTTTGPRRDALILVNDLTSFPKVTAGVRGAP